MGHAAEVMRVGFGDVEPFHERAGVLAFRQVAERGAHGIVARLFVLFDQAFEGRVLTGLELLLPGRFAGAGEAEQLT